MQSLDLSPPVSDEVKTTTCYMCACRCGIKVHLTDGKIRYIEGNRDHPVNRGVLCAKGAAGIMQHYAPARLTKPLKRIGERGAGDFAEIEWDEALGLATEWLRRIRESDPRKLAFFTGRDQSQALTGWWATQFGTPNYAAHGGFCSVNMAAGGFYTIGGSFWEFGEPDWERTRYFMLFGCAEDHASNPLKIALGGLKARGIKFVSINPVRTGYSAIADEWLGIRPGTDGLFVLALVHELLRAGKIDVDYLIRYTNAPWLVIQDPGADEDGLFARDEAGRPLVWDRMQKAPRAAFDPDVRPALKGEVTLADGRRAKPVFHLLAERYLADEYSPEAVAPRTGIPAATIRRIAAELAHTAFEQAIAAGRALDRCLGAAALSRRSDGRSACTPCAASRRTPTASTPAAPCICCRSCSARSMYRAVFGTSRRIPNRSRPDPSPPGRPGRSCPADRCRGRRSAFRRARRISWSRPTARRGGSTRRSPGRRRSPPTACCTW